VVGEELFEEFGVDYHESGEENVVPGDKSDAGMLLNELFHPVKAIMMSLDVISAEQTCLGVVDV